MEIKGDEFIKNVKLESEKAELKKRTEALDAQMTSAVIKQEEADEPVVVDIPQVNSTELEDLRLENSKDDKEKKKYIILGIALIILFVLTIVIIRLISSDKDEEELFDTPIVETIEQDNILNAPDANDKYQALIEKKAKRTVQKKLNINDIVQKETPLPNIEEKKDKNKIIEKTSKPTTTTDLFEMENETIDNEKVTKTEVKEVIKTKKIEPKLPVIKPPVIETKKIEPIKQVRHSIFYIQVGAFTKTPNPKLLKRIQQNNFDYIIHKMTIKNKIYNKVLIGSYKSKKEAREKLNMVKQTLKAPDAYIFRLK